MRRFFFAIFGLFLISKSSQIWALGINPPQPHTPLETAKGVDLFRYQGKWYEIARLPQSFEEGCVGVSAEYFLRRDWKMKVRNSCHHETCSGPVSVAEGIARTTEPKDSSKLKVAFFKGAPEGDYWILEVDPDYTYAVVGTPDRGSFWILSRTRTLPETQVQDILKRFSAKGFSFESLERPQPCE